MRRSRLLIAVLVTSFVPVVSANAKIRKPPSRVGTTITVNRGIGVLRPGITERQVRAALGKPDRTRRISNGAESRPVRIEYEKKFGLSVGFAPNETTDAVGFITVSTSQYRTVEGARVGWKLSQLRAAYPLLTADPPSTENGCFGSRTSRSTFCILRVPPAVGKNYGMVTTFFLPKKTRVATITVARYRP